MILSPSKLISRCLLTMLLISVGDCQLLDKPTIRVDMDDAGMHRNLQYNVKFNNKLEEMDCEYIISQPLPAAVYISTDELDDLQRLKMINAVYPKFVNIEIITENAEPFTVLLRGSTKMAETIKLPVHFRYHAASITQNTASVGISTPELYLRCPYDKDLIDIGFVNKPDKFYCLNERAQYFEHHQALNEGDDCNWRQVHVSFLMKKPLEAFIPVGDANGYTFVLYATIALSWAASIWIIFYTRTVPLRISQELGAQRKLQQREAKLN